jgi:hypothetical protein
MRCLFILLVLVINNNVHAQKAEDSVKAVINKMFDAMLQSDAVMLNDCFADSAILQTIAKDGIVKTGYAGDFIKQVSGLQKNAADERISFAAIHIDGSLASVWTPYKFYYNGNFSHCGVNSFQLVRINGKWKIQYIIDTRRRQNCVD